MTLLREIIGLLRLRDESLRSLASRGRLLPALAGFLAGFLAFAVVRSVVYAELGESRAAASPLDYLLRLNVVPALAYFAILLVPVLLSLSNALAGDGLGFTISRGEYRSWLAALLPLWGALFLVSAPVQWLLPHFLVLGDFGISIGLLVLSSLTIFYTIWGSGRLGNVSPPVAASVVVLSCLTLPGLYLLAERPFVAVLILAGSAVCWFWIRMKARAVEMRSERSLEQRIAALEPRREDAEAQHRTGLMQARLGRLDAAADSLERAVRLRPDSPEYHYELGRIFEARAEWQAALEQYEAARGLAPHCCQGKVSREAGKAFLHTDASDRAEELLKSFLQGHHSDPEARYWLAVALERNDRAEEARVQLHTLLEQARSNPRLSRKENREWVLRTRAQLRDSP